MRFAGDIHYEKDIAPGLEEIRLPSMILQPLVENAVNHGIRNVEWEGHIRLKVECESSFLVIRVIDNGQGMTQERIKEVLDGQMCRPDGQRDSTGIGMDNVISRLELFFGQKNLLQIESGGVGKGTEVRLMIPVEIMSA